MSTGPIPYIGSSTTLNNQPLICSPVGIEIGVPRSITSVPLVRPSVDSMAIALHEQGIAGPVSFDLLPGNYNNTHLVLLDINLRDKNLKVHIETSGAYPLSGVWDWICLSPKKYKLPTQTVYDNADELKVIIYNKHDFIFAEEQAEKVNKNAILFLQPEWSKREEMTPLIVDYVMNNPKWRVSLQTHKYLNIP